MEFARARSSPSRVTVARDQQALLTPLTRASRRASPHCHIACDIVGHFCLDFQLTIVVHAGIRRRV
jgi:hypothetical protein